MGTLSQMDGSERGDDDFEVVPVQEDDGMQWDIENEDEDEIKKAKIQSKPFSDFELTNGRSSADVVTLPVEQRRVF